jgi:autotransporter-associated beta strand protein
MMTAFTLTLHSFGADGTWTNDASGTWGTAGNWAGGTIANGAGSLANFSTIDITAARTVTLDTSRTIGGLIFGDANWSNSGFNWALQSSGGTILTLDNTGGPGGNPPTITAGFANGTLTSIRAVLAGSNGLNLSLLWSNYDSTRGTASASAGLTVSQTSARFIFSVENTLSGALTVMDGGLVQTYGAFTNFGTATSLVLSGNSVFQNGESNTGTPANNNGVSNRIGDGTATLSLGGASGAGTFTMAFPSAANTHAQTFAGLTVNAGQNVLNTVGTVAGTLNLTFTGTGGAGYVRNTNGLVNVVSASGFNPQFANAPTALGGSSVSGTAASGDEILIGATLAGSDFIKAASGNLAAATYVTTLTADKNVNVTGALATSGSLSINSLRLGDTTKRTLTIGASDTLTLASGGILLPLSVTTDNINHTLTGGSLTSSQGDLWIYSASGTQTTRTGNVNGNPRAAIYAATIASKITGNISLTVGSGFGSQVVISGANDYTGGTYLQNGFIALSADSGLGAASGAVTAVSGVNNIQPTVANIIFNASRNFVINSGAQLGISGGTSATIPGQVSGGGQLQIGFVGGGGLLLILTGNNSGFTGQYLVNSYLRADEGTGLSTNANLVFTGRDLSNSGVLETSGTFTRSLGSRAGQVQWQNQGGYAGGGFAAVGGALTVNIGGSVTPDTLTWGSGFFLPSNGALNLGEGNSTADVTFQNPIALNGAQRYINVAAAGTTKATLSGVLSGNASSGITKLDTGTLVLAGDNTYQGPTLVSAGTLALGHTNALQNSTLDMGLAGTRSATFTVSGTNAYNLGGLRGTNNIALGANTLVIGSNNSTNTYWGTLSGLGGGLVKTGAGMLTLAGTNTYTGATIAQTGVLELTLTNALSAATALDIRSGAEVRLSFTGTNVVYSLTINGVTKSRGVYAAGSVPGLTGTAGAYLQTLEPLPMGTMIRFL